MPEATMTFDELDSPPKASGGATMTFDQLDQPEANAAPFWSWERIKKAYQTSPEIADVRPVEGKILKNAAIGAGEAATGLGELAPDFLGGGLAAKGTQWLESKADPEYWPAKLAGEAGATLLGGEAVGAGKLLGGGASFLGSVGRGALAGGATGALAPTGKEDTADRYKEKGEDAAIGAATGGAIGTLPPVARGVRSIYDKATGKEANEAAEAVRAKVADEAASASGKATGDLKMTLGPASSADEAALIAQNKQNEAEAVQAGADYLAQTFANTPTIDQVQAGTQVRKLAESIFTKGDEARRTASGIPQILQSYGDQPIVDVKPLMEGVRAELKRVAPGGSVEGELQKIQEFLSTSNGKLSLYQADSVRKELQKIMSLKQMAIGNSYRNVDKATMAIVRRVYKDLTTAAGDAAPEYKTAMDTWRRLSRPLDFLERKGALAKARMTDDLSGDYSKLEGGIIKELVSKAKQGDASFGKLLAADPGLKDSARAYFAGELFGRGPAQGAVTADQFAKFLAENKRALDQLGLYGEFADKQIAQKTADDLAERMKDESDAATDTAKKAKGLEELETKYTALVNTLTKTDLPADEVTKTVEPFLAKLRDDGFITEDQRADLQKQIHYIEKSYRTHAEFKRHAVNWLRYGVGGLIGAAGIEGLRRFWF